MVKTVLLILLAAIVLLLIVAATKHDNFRIERSVRIQAPTERVHGLISSDRPITYPIQLARHQKHCCRPAQCF